MSETSVTMCTVDESRGSPNESDHLVVVDHGDSSEQRDKMREDIFDDRYFGRLPVNEVLVSFSPSLSPSPLSSLSSMCMCATSSFYYSIFIYYPLFILSWVGMGKQGRGDSDLFMSFLCFSGEGSAGIDVMLQSWCFFLFDFWGIYNFFFFKFWFIHVTNNNSFVLKTVSNGRSREWWEGILFSSPNSTLSDTDNQWHKNTSRF